jgi:DtxR family Mn-dependent transcriptional regulator
MANHNNYLVNAMSDKIKLSKSEEMYLVTIRMNCEHCKDVTIPIPDIAESLDVQPVSANQMIKKLVEGGYVNYTPYKGVALTPRGQDISTRILRHRRLWEVFLVKNLNMDLDKADALACQLEHITTDDVADRLSQFLDNPTVCFHGDPIYSSTIDTKESNCVALSDVKVGQPFQIVRIEGDTTLCGFLSDVGVLSGNRGSVIAADSFGNILVETGFEEKLTITQEIADHIIVEEQYV